MVNSSDRVIYNSDFQVVVHIFIDTNPVTGDCNGCFKANLLV